MLSDPGIYSDVLSQRQLYSDVLFHGGVWVCYTRVSRDIQCHDR